MEGNTDIIAYGTALCIRGIAERRKMTDNFKKRIVLIIPMCFFILTFVVFFVLFLFDRGSFLLRTLWVASMGFALLFRGLDLFINLKQKVFSLSYILLALIQFAFILLSL